ncbi:uncharacterized protein LOC106668090 [Cimex lectularius]|uniref:Uncharacterized protein n=1 Tax=Cimex lectularius TaxID=79782 RepID=A0A8I6RY61_CIMLE|nr:uncharacterized protein LOC106668090 [Cimex lectularius]
MIVKLAVAFLLIGAFIEGFPFPQAGNRKETTQPADKGCTRDSWTTNVETCVCKDGVTTCRKTSEMHTPPEPFVRFLYQPAYVLYPYPVGYPAYNPTYSNMRPSNYTGYRPGHSGYYPFRLNYTKPHTPTYYNPYPYY